MHSPQATMENKNHALIDSIKKAMADKGYNGHFVSKQTGVPYQRFLDMNRKNPSVPKGQELLAILSFLGMLDTHSQVPVIGTATQGGVISALGEYPIAELTSNVPKEASALLEHVPAPPGTDPTGMRAIDLGNGEVVYFIKQLTSDFDGLLNKVCIVCLHDRQVIIGTLLRGASAGLHDVMITGGITMRDLRVSWAAKREWSWYR